LLEAFDQFQIRIPNTLVQSTKKRAEIISTVVTSKLAGALLYPQPRISVDAARRAGVDLIILHDEHSCIDGLWRMLARKFADFGNHFGSSARITGLPEFK